MLSHAGRGCGMTGGVRYRLTWLATLTPLLAGSVLMQVPALPETAAVTDVWQARYGQLGVVVVRRFETGNGVLAMQMTGLRARAKYTVLLARGSCSLTTIFRSTLTATSTGRIGRTLALTASQLTATDGRPAVKVGSTCRVLTRMFPPPSTPTPSPSRAPTLDDLLRRCPTVAEVASLHADLAIAFDHDPSAPTLVCRADAGSVDLTQVQAATYSTLLAMRSIPFDAPLPWTSRPLYGWFTDVVGGMRVTGEGTLSFCCEPGPTIVVVVQANSYLMLTRRWIDPQIGGGLQDAAALFIHEARHAEGKPHTCGSNDATRSEMGAWGVQYEFFRWLALHADRNFLGGVDEPSPGYYAQIAASNAQSTLNTRFCSPT